MVQKLIRDGSAPAGWAQPPSVPGLWVNLCWSVLRVAKVQRAEHPKDAMFDFCYTAPNVVQKHLRTKWLEVVQKGILDEATLKAMQGLLDDLKKTLVRSSHSK